MTRMTTHSIPFPDPLWQRVVEAAKAASQDAGRSISAAEYIRQAVEWMLEDEGRLG